MKRFVIFFLLPSLCFAQKPVPRFEHDTVYTTCGFKIYKGQTLQLGHGNENGKLRFVRDNWKLYGFPFGDGKITILYFEKYIISRMGNPYIDVAVDLVTKKGKKVMGGMKIYFDKAIEPSASLGPEIIVPDEFRVKISVGSIADEIAKLNKLYQDSIITKEEFEMAKRKLLEKK
jgi:hypothetical protein